MTFAAPNVGEPPTVSTVHLDPVALAELRAVDPQRRLGLIARVAATFETLIGRLLPELQAARAAGDAKEIWRVAHTLKSSAAQVGALDLSRICVAVEVQARAGHGATDGLNDAIDILCRQAEGTLAALQALPEASGG